MTLLAVEHPDWMLDAECTRAATPELGCCCGHIQPDDYIDPDASYYDDEDWQAATP